MTGWALVLLILLIWAGMILLLLIPVVKNRGLKIGRWGCTLQTYYAKICKYRIFCKKTPARHMIELE